ncbi:hypothetical protein CC80DRAFT_541798 [Byssothecium circinans]|uniref:VOC domain-containing protein n=1 Tax=Byssothecium circinans TaxID=147558 RepID=A0A6A5UIB1_9PLEO|nr:hypothetical protein CC80DRAFT_541798 [Byssothecium circinans]
MATTTTTIPSLDDLPAKPKDLSPSSIAHVGLQTTMDNLSVMRDFYTTFTGGHVVFDAPYASFLTYDSEHHRIAFVTFPQYKPGVPDTAGLSHIAFTFASLTDLLTTYQQRKKFEETTKYMMGEAFQKNPLGSEFVPEDLIEKLKAGVSEKELKRKGDGVDMRPDEFVARTR